MINYSEPGDEQGEHGQCPERHDEPERRREVERGPMAIPRQRHPTGDIATGGPAIVGPTQEATRELRYRPTEPGRDEVVDWHRAIVRVEEVTNATP